MIRNQWLLVTASFYLSLVCCQTAFGSSSRQARVVRSAFEHLRDHGTYIIHFNNAVKEVELQHFAAVLEEEFVAKVIEKFFIINCLTAKFSKIALQWVRVNNYLPYSYMVITVLVVHITWAFNIIICPCNYRLLYV